MTYYTPLRYPGGKGKLAAFIQEIYKANDLSDGTYVEPYAGGAAIALKLLLEGFAWNIIINDIDKRIFSFWWSILNETEQFCKKINDCKVDIATWNKQKFIHLNIDQYSLEEIGFATFFLNRTNRSGILSAGVIGGKNQTGNFKIDARFNKRDLISRIELIAKYKSRIKLYNKDALILMREINNTFNKKTLVYYDPPYFKKGKLLYHNFYTYEDHQSLATFIRGTNYPWIVTYDNVKEIKEMYLGENYANFDISYYAHMDRPKGKEILFYNHIKLPCMPYTCKALYLRNMARC